jgi:hypothetical protein
MRYMLAMVLALGIGVAAAVPAAFAGEEAGQDRFVSPAAVQTESIDLGMVAGADAPNQIVVPDHN